MRIYTNRGTAWAGCDWGQMRSGHRVDVRAYRANETWIASTMRNWNNSSGARGANGIRSGSGYHETRGWNGYNGMHHGYGDDWGYGGMMR